MGVLSQNQLLGASGAVSGDGYEVSRTLKQDEDDSSNLKFTPSSAASANNKFTYSFWIKGRRDQDYLPILYVPHASGGNRSVISVHADGWLAYTQNSGGGTQQRRTLRKMRDPSGWYHCVVAFDGTESSQTDRTRLYINGDLQAHDTSWSDSMGTTDPSINVQNLEQKIGEEGYMILGEVHMVDGQVKTASDFGETNSNGVWVPKEYTGTHGNNGYFLNFSTTTDLTTIGKDHSANSNDWTAVSYQVTGKDAVVSDYIKYTNYTSSGMSQMYPSGSDVTGHESSARQICHTVSTSTGNHGNDQNSRRYSTFSFWIRRMNVNDGTQISRWSNGGCQMGVDGKNSGETAGMFWITDGGDRCKFKCGTTLLNRADKFYHIHIKYRYRGEGYGCWVWIDGVAQDVDDSPVGWTNNNVNNGSSAGGDHGHFGCPNKTYNWFLAGGWEYWGSRAVLCNHWFGAAQWRDVGNFAEDVNGVWTSKALATIKGYNTGYYGFHVCGESTTTYDDSSDNSNVTINPPTGLTYQTMFQCIVPFTMNSSENIDKFEYNATDTPLIGNHKSTSKPFGRVASQSTTDGDGRTVVWMYQLDAGGYWEGEFKNLDLHGTDGAHKLSIASTLADHRYIDTTVDSPAFSGDDSSNIGGVERRNYPTLSPIDKSSNLHIQDGNSTVRTIDSYWIWAPVCSTIQLPKSGKWMVEIRDPVRFCAIGICDTDGYGARIFKYHNTDELMIRDEIRVLENGGSKQAFKYGNGMTATLSSNCQNCGDVVFYGDDISTNPDIGHQIAIDMDNKKIWFGQRKYDTNAANNNGAQIWVKSGGYGTDGNPATGAYPTYSGFNADQKLIIIYKEQSYPHMNFGSHEFRTLALPTGYKWLNYANWPDPAVSNPKTAFDVKLWSGNATDDRAITGYGHTPGLVVIKARGHAYEFGWYDVLRGGNKKLHTNDDGAEDTDTDCVKSFTSDGFTLGTNNRVNNSPRAYVGYSWDMGSSNTSISAGDASNGSPDIASTVRVNQTAGQGMFSYTGIGGAYKKVAHGLGSKPDLIIIKNRSSSGDWQVYSSTLGYTKRLRINTDDIQDTSNEPWYVEPTDKVVTFKTDNSVNADGDDYIGYCFKSVDQYSKFGWFVGTGDTDGPFLHCGFKPRLLWIKKFENSSTPRGWFVYDRDRYETDWGSANNLLLNTTGTSPVESGYYLDFTSHGVKLRNGGNGVNGSVSDKYLFMAWADELVTNTNAY